MNGIKDVMFWAKANIGFGILLYTLLYYRYAFTNQKPAKPKEQCTNVYVQAFKKIKQKYDNNIL